MCNNNPYYSRILEVVLGLFFFNKQFTLTNIWFFFLRDLNYFQNNILCVAMSLILLVFELITDNYLCGVLPLYLHFVTCYNHSDGVFFI
jgi:hypothetical protein